MIKKETIQELAQERIDELNAGIFIVDISVSSTNHIQIEVERESGSIAIEECVSISRNVEHNLDREEEDFSLEVGSPGLDKPFQVPQQYMKNVGRKVKVKANDAKLEGELVAADAEGFVVKTSEKQRVEGKKKKIVVEQEHAFKYGDVTECKIVITFK